MYIYSRPEGLYWLCIANYNTAVSKVLSHASVHTHTHTHTQTHIHTHTHTKKHTHTQ
jgi:hypothetical protein